MAVTTSALLRIAVVTETYPPEVNGVALSLARVVEGLRERHHDVQLIRPRQPADACAAGEREGALLVRGLPIPRYPHLTMGVPAVRLLLNRWRAERPDLVHIATEGPLGWSALQAATRLALPVCSDFRTNFHAYSRHYGIGWLQRPIRAYLRHFHNRTACTMVPTEALRRELAADGFENLTVLARGVDTQRFHPRHRRLALRAAWGAGPSTRVVLCVGRLAPEKNLGLLIDAYEAMRRIDADLRLVFVGDGPTRRELQRRCPEAIFAGQRADEELAAHYASADLFVFTSMTETYGNVTPEAMASGLAVLAFAHAAAGQLIHSGESGLLAPLGDGAAFVRQAESLVRDRAAAQAMAERGRERVAELGWGRIIDQVEAVHRAVSWQPSRIFACQRRPA